MADKLSAAPRNTTPPADCALGACVLPRTRRFWLVLLAFVIFGPAHWAILAAIVLFPLLMAALAQWARHEKITRALGWALAGIAIAGKLAAYGFAWRFDEINAREALPMHLCDWAEFAAIFALIFRGQIAYELNFFWGLAGTLQALLTPDLAFDFPDPRAFTFFINHGVIIGSVIFLTVAARMRPCPRSIVRAFACSQLYVFAAGAVDWLLGVNYGYLCSKPAHASLMDHFGPWPVYVLVLEPLALASYAIYYAPFFLADKTRFKIPAPAEVPSRR